VPWKRIKTLDELEDPRMMLKDLESCITDNQFVILILKNVTSIYDLQLTMIAKRINDKVNPIKIDEIRDDLSLRFEWLNMKANKENEVEVVEELALFGSQFKGECRTWGAIVHKAQDCKKNTQQNDGN
jgi:hypothetical protein